MSHPRFVYPACPALPEFRGEARREPLPQSATPLLSSFLLKPDVRTGLDVIAFYFELSTEHPTRMLILSVPFAKDLSLNSELPSPSPKPFSCHSYGGNNILDKSNGLGYYLACEGRHERQTQDSPTS